MKDLSFEEECDLRAVHKNVRHIVVEVLWGNYRAEKILTDDEEVEKIKDQVVRRINFEKYGVKSLLKNMTLLEELAKANTIYVLNHVYKLTPVNDTKTKLTNVNYNRFNRVGLKRIDTQKNQDPREVK